MTALGWGIIGTGSIASTFAKDLPFSETGRLVAVGSRSQASADAFVAKIGARGVSAHGSYDALLANPAVEAVYIATPHPQHAEWAIKAAQAGKHVLVEKPLGMNAAEVEAIIDAATENGVFLMEAFMYRCHPQIAHVLELIRSGAIGEVRVIRASFGFHWPIPYDPTSRLLDPAQGGGAILDVGCYAMSFARMVAGAALGKSFAEPIDVQAAGTTGRSGVDEWAVANLRFEGGILAQLEAAIQCELADDARISGSEGSITLTTPWSPGINGEPRVLIARHGQPPEELIVGAARPLYALEADNASEHIAARQSPAMTWADSLGNARALDRWREAIDMGYPAENASGFPTRLTRGPGRAVAAAIPKVTLPGFHKPVSRLALGVHADKNKAAIMFDAFFESGGNVFDTAWSYGAGEGECDRVLGRWMASRNCREDVVIVAKGAHTPDCNPEALSRQLLASLDCLGTTYADVYCMHRDNPEIPVVEFVEVLNEHRRKGHIRVIGVSNWSLPRVRAFNAYASDHGLEGIGIVSNNFSLARMVNPVWPGCETSSGPEPRAWHDWTQTPLLAWSSQARGFFVRGSPTDTLDSDLVHAWYSEDNFERLVRARQMADAKSVSANNIALSYVLEQHFPTIALVGPASLAELRSTLPALSITLTEREMGWLNLERPSLVR